MIGCTLDRWAWLGTIAMAAVGLTSARADIIVTTGMQPWEICATCHSLNGISAMARFPKLAGQRPAYIVKQVRDFRDGLRRNDGGQMEATASDISDDDLARVAAYFGGLPAPPPDGSFSMDSEEWRRGAALNQDGDPARGIASCRSCHEDSEGSRLQGPFLKAQHAAYLAKQLRDWRLGERTNDESQTMPAIAAKLSEEDIAAIAAFLASQPRSRSETEAAK
jgi:cytochrome c553